MVSQMLYLASADPEADITIYINSPGGSVQAGLAIFDTMQYIPCDVRTVCYGMAASMGAFLLSAGTKGKRKSLPNSRIMIHQPLGGAQGQAADIEIQAKEILFVKSLLNRCALAAAAWLYMHRRQRCCARRSCTKLPPSGGRSRIRFWRARSRICVCSGACLWVYLWAPLLCFFWRCQRVRESDGCGRACGAAIWPTPLASPSTRSRRTLTATSS